jgi:hypothetical protein
MDGFIEKYIHCEHILDFIGNKKSHAKPQSSQSFSKEYPEKLGFLVEISWRSWRLCEKRIISDNVYSLL